MLGQRGWMYNFCDNGPWLEERWIQFDPGGESVVNDVLAANWRNPVKSRVTTYDEYSPYYPSVVVSAEAKVDTTLGKMFGMNDIDVKVFSQAAVSYIDVHGGWEYGRSTPPDTIPPGEVY